MVGVSMMDEVVRTNAKAEVVADTEIFAKLIQVLSSFSHFYKKIEDNVWFKCGRRNFTDFFLLHFS